MRFASSTRGNGHCLHQFLCWSGGESLDPGGVILPLVGMT